MFGVVANKIGKNDRELVAALTQIVLRGVSTSSIDQRAAQRVALPDRADGPRDFGRRYTKRARTVGSVFEEGGR